MIKPTDDMPTAHAGIDVNSLLCESEQRNVYQMVLDVKLAPRLNDAKSPEPRFSSAQWSPQGMFQDHRCMIATLTCLGCLKVHVPYSNSWLEIVDVSNLWTEHCKSNLDNDYIITVEDKFVALQKRTSEMKITGMVWGNFQLSNSSKTFVFMATISHSGELALWQFHPLRSLAHLEDSYFPNLVTTCQTNLLNCITLHWLKWNENEFAVVFGDTNGCAKAITFTLNENVSSAAKKTTLDIWTDSDQMKVTCIKILGSPQGKEDERIIVLAKNSYLLAFLITENEVLASCHELVGSLSITGIELMNKNSVIVCTAAGYLCQYSIYTNRSRNMSIQAKPLTSSIVWNDLSCFGIAKNLQNVWVIGVSICKLYDHLLIRRPSQLVFVSVPDVPDYLSELQSSSAKKLRHYWTYLEVVRTEYMKQQKSPPLPHLKCPQDLENISTNQLQFELWLGRIAVAQLVAADTTSKNPDICAFITLLEEIIFCRYACSRIYALVEKHNSQPLDDRRLCEVKRLRSWLQHWVVNQDSLQINAEDGQSNTKGSQMTTSTEETDMKSECPDISQNSGNSSSNNSIADPCELHTDDSVAECVMDETSNSSDSLSVGSVSKDGIKKLQGEQTRVPASFLKVKLNKTYKEVTEKLVSSLLHSVPNSEVCEFCKQEISVDLDWRISVCPANHRVSRCCKCLAQCHRLPFRLCNVCPTVACIDLDDLEPYCTFCDSPLQVDEKLKVTGSPPKKSVEVVLKKPVATNTPKDPDIKEEEKEKVKVETLPEDEQMDLDC